MTTQQPVEPVAAIVVAAGSGVRLGGGEPKALRLLGGESLVRHSVRAMVAGGCSRVVVVVAAGMEDRFAADLSDFPVTVVAGGKERQESVAAGLAALDPEPPFVLVHDAARPLVPVEVVDRVIEAVEDGATAVIPVIPVVDSIRQVTGEGSAVVDRAALRAVQTPQGFETAVLKLAHAHVAEQGIAVTDDAAACEALGREVVLVAGDVASMKITNPHDLALAAALAEQLAGANPS
ncbi:2-C-methyl-D-erythritol 4-phosphate cytidylyltransferase [Parenemella sanctibonifatiensis]|uniref:2-C-methyl-D-erythritol 4-phosphate cytidylyltransferase n=1 Tax=Parenemella sanctibonifatiensis TaxID=2016505 RepID=A0A255ELU2_9ACTN|nr:2-C-methyl-D-erythritol 4-phosphate cytidylyltransferase [Parenemella sanctibonifatiensis]OYN92507.1 2-C-methyl-D-erythritol 4-phosphate cytidylyltransferase [Parenemella sanctibonifatiensis]